MKFILSVLSCLLLAFFFFSCSQKLPENAIQTILQTEEILLKEEVGGLGSVGGIKHYILFSKSSYFEGVATFPFLLYGIPPKKNTYKKHILIPNEKINEFLSHLSDCKLKNIEYKPYYRVGTDWDQNIYIELRSQSGVVIFSSESHNDNYVPWQLKWEKESYVIDSSCPMQAIKILTPYLKEDTYQRLLAQAQRKVDNFKQKMIKEELEKRSNGEKVKPKNTNRQ